MKASQVALMVKNPPTSAGRCKRHRSNPWIGKISWRRAWQHTPVFLPEESYGQRSLSGYKGRRDSDTTERLSLYLNFTWDHGGQQQKNCCKFPLHSKELCHTCKRGAPKVVGRCFISHPQTNNGRSKAKHTGKRNIFAGKKKIIWEWCKCVKTFETLPLGGG